MRRCETGEEVKVYGDLVVNYEAASGRLCCKLDNVMVEQANEKIPECRKDASILDNGEWINDKIFSEACLCGLLEWIPTARLPPICLQRRDDPQAHIVANHYWSVVRYSRVSSDYNYQVFAVHLIWASVTGGVACVRT